MEQQDTSKSAMPQHRNRSKQVTLWITPEKKEAWREFADSKGMSMSRLVVEAVDRLIAAEAVRDMMHEAEQEPAYTWTAVTPNSLWKAEDAATGNSASIARAVDEWLWVVSDPDGQALAKGRESLSLPLEAIRTKVAGALDAIRSTRS